QIVHIVEQATQIDDFGLERLPAPESEQLRGELRPARYAGQSVLNPSFGPVIAGHIPGKKLQIAADHLEQVVEIMGDPAGQLAERLDLLSMAKRGLGLL